MRLCSTLGLSAFAALALSLSAADTPAPAAAPKEKAADPRPRSDAAGNPLRYAATGHVSNYDESKVGAYTLPDPLVLENGRPVRDADTWRKQRRPEILKLYESEIHGRVPARAEGDVRGHRHRRLGGGGQGDPQAHRLLGKTDLGTNELPPLDRPLTNRTLGFHYHTGGRAITASDWTAFLELADRHLQPSI